MGRVDPLTGRQSPSSLPPATAHGLVARQAVRAVRDHENAMRMWPTHHRDGRRAERERKNGLALSRRVRVTFLTAIADGARRASGRPIERDETMSDPTKRVDPGAVPVVWCQSGVSSRACVAVTFPSS